MRPEYFWQSPVHLVTLVIVVVALLGGFRYNRR